MWLPPPQHARAQPAGVRACGGGSATPFSLFTVRGKQLAPLPETRDVGVCRGLSTKQFFQAMDKDGNGSVSKEEFEQTMNEFGLLSGQLEGELDEFFAQLDVSTPPVSHSYRANSFADPDGFIN